MAYNIDAYAKINLGLDVIGRREDGYHLVRMVMQTVGLCDSLSFEPNSSGEISIRSNVDLGPARNNLIYKAVELIRSEFGITDGVDVDLHKRIPAAAGLAGGSSDCAAALKAMNSLFSLEIPDEKLAAYGVRLGADVPYCLMGGTALAEGIGEVLSPLGSVPEAYVILVKPPLGISTKEIYERLDSESDIGHPDIDGLIAAVGRKDLDGICGLMGNVLEKVSCGIYPVINEIRNDMKAMGAKGAMMSGSGPTVFGLFDDHDTASKAYQRFKSSRFGEATFLTGFTAP